MLSKEFVNEVVNAVKVLIPTMEVECTKVLKNNDVTLNGVVIKTPNKNIFPTIYIEHFAKDGDVVQIAKRIVETYHKHSQEGNDYENVVELLKDYGSVRPLLRVHLVNKKNNEKLLNEVPYLPFLDMAMIVVVDIGNATVKVTNKMLEEWHIKDIADIIHIAKENTFSTPYLLKSMAEVLGMPDFMFDIMKMYVLSNNKGFYGATEICNNSTMQNIANKLQADLIVLPSSIHEVIIMPKKNNDNIEELTTMVQKVNASDVDTDEVLSDHYYIYTRENGWGF